MLNEIKKLKVLMFGFAFKENCPDIRNTKVYDLYLNLKKNFKNVKIYDPEVSFKEVYQHYNLKLEKKLHQNCDILILAVPHNSLRKLSKKILLTNKKVIFYDLKSIFPKNFSQIRL